MSGPFGLDPTELALVALGAAMTTFSLFFRFVVAQHEAATSNTGMTSGTVGSRLGLLLVIGGVVLTAAAYRRFRRTRFAILAATHIEVPDGTLEGIIMAALLATGSAIFLAVIRVPV